MRYGAHVSTAAAVWGAACIGLGFQPEPAGFALVCLGSVLPDIDHEESWIGRRVGFIATLVKTYAGGHRGATHACWPVVALFLASFVWPYLTPVAVGYATHLAGDYLCDGGIPLLWGYDNRRFGQHLFVTGDRCETFIALGAVAAAFVLVQIAAAWAPVVGTVLAG